MIGQSVCGRVIKSFANEIASLFFKRQLRKNEHRELGCTREQGGQLVEKNVPVQMLINFLDENGKVKKDEQLSVDEKAVKIEIETQTTGTMHKYAYRPAAFGETDSVKAISTKVVDAIKVALESAGR